MVEAKMTNHVCRCVTGTVSLTVRIIIVHPHCSPSPSLPPFLPLCSASFSSNGRQGKCPRGWHSFRIYSDERAALDRLPYSNEFRYLESDFVCVPYRYVREVAVRLREYQRMRGEEAQKPYPTPPKNMIRLQKEGRVRLEAQSTPIQSAESGEADVSDTDSSMSEEVTENKITDTESQLRRIPATLATG